MKYWLLPLATLLIAAPAIADNWTATGIATASGATLFIDMASIRRSAKDYNRISYRVRLASSSESVQARVNGNCSTGSWRVSNGGKRTTKATKRGGVLMVFPEEMGDRSLQYACSVPIQVITPRSTHKSRSF